MALTAQQTDELKHLIGKRRQALIAELRRDAAKARGESFGEIAGPAPDSGDESVAALIADLDQADLSRDLGELRGLEAARTRLADGSYGVCVDCGSDIGVERLRAEPGAPRCIRCQALHEKTFAGTGRSSL
jgi:RNA polymerase-binding transcription factor DksA